MYVDRGMHRHTHVKIAESQISQLCCPSLRCCGPSSPARRHAEAACEGTSAYAAEVACAAQGCASGVGASRTRHAYWRALRRRRSDGGREVNGPDHPDETSDGHDRYALDASRSCRRHRRRRYNDRRSRTVACLTAATAAAEALVRGRSLRARSSWATSSARYGLDAGRSCRGTGKTYGVAQGSRRYRARLTVYLYK